MRPKLPTSLVGALMHPWTWKMAWRDSRSQRWRLLLFALAMVAGIAGLVTIHSLKATLEKGLESQMQELLGSDLMVTARQPFTEAEITKLSQNATRVTKETTFPTMVQFASGGARMVSLRALEGDFPFYGQFKTEPAEAFAKMQRESGILLPPSMLRQFEAKVGDMVTLGKSQIPILGEISEAAPSASQMSNFAPEAYVALGNLKDTGLVERNSMLNHVMHLQLSTPGAYKALKKRYQDEFKQQNWRFQTPEDRRNQIGKVLENFQRFLGILALASLGLGAIGVAGAVQSHLNRRLQSIAILQCLGAPQGMSSAIYMAQTAVLGCLGAILGALVGVGLHLGILTLYRDQLPITIAPTPELKIAVLAALSGFLVCCGFAMIPLGKIRSISPVATMREGARLSGSFWQSLPSYFVLASLLLALAWQHEGSGMRALVLVGALGLAFALVAGVAKLLMIFTRWILRPSWPYVMRQGISNLYRPGNQTQLFLLSLGLGTFLVLTIVLIGQQLRQRLDLTLYDDAPSLYLVDVQPDQLDAVEDLIRARNLPILETSPMVTMRVESIRGVPVREIKDIPRWIGTREFRSTYRKHLSSKETLTAGTWHEQQPNPGAPVPLSLEEKLAHDMKVKLGDRLTLDVQGVPVEAEVTSLRHVDWGGASLNFFMVFTPDTLEGAPGFHVVTTKTHDAEVSGELQLAIMKGFGNITSIDLSQILEKVNTMMQRVSRVIQILGYITVLAALPIVAGTFLNGKEVRLRESVLLRTLGASSAQIRSILCVEYAALGVLSGLTGVGLAVLASGWFGHEIGVPLALPDLGACLIALGLNVGVSIGGGLLLSRGVAAHSPLEVLRHA